MKNIIRIGLTAAVLPLAGCNKDIPDNRPNVIFILADDLGYMDVGFFAQLVTGTPTEKMFYETPNIDRMAREGQVFSSAYACPLSSPTRASILTGKYAARIGFTTALWMQDTWYMTGQEPPAGAYVHDALNHSDDISIEQALLNGKSNSAIPAGRPADRGRREIILPEAIEGYHRAFIGKWHVGGFGAEGYQPADRGFDEVPAYYDSGASAHLNWREDWNDRSKVLFPDMPQAEWKVGDAGEDIGERFLSDDLTGKALKYIDERTAAKDGPFFLYLNHFAVHAPIQARAEDVAYFESKPTLGWNDHSNPEYAGLVKSLDDSVGRIFEKLEQNGLADNTLVIFMSDNGGVNRNTASHRTSVTDNTPYTGSKATVFEGGIKVPLIVWWKGKAASGSVCDVPVDACDIFPTLVETCGGNPAGYYENNHIDGRSILPLLSDPQNKSGNYPREEFVWHYPFNVICSNPVDGLPLTPHSAIRSGAMKLIYDWHGRLYLFDMKNDPFERVNLAGLQPETTNELFGKLVKWLDENVEERYLPSKNPDYDPSKESRKTVPYTDLVAIYRSGGDVAGAAIYPDMGKMTIKTITANLL